MKPTSLFEKMRHALAVRPRTAVPRAIEERTTPSQNAACGEGTPSLKHDRRACPGVPLPELQLVLGIDLGTSCTKVVIGDPDWKNVAYAVPYDETSPGIAAFLHPTRFGKSLNLKMRLMDDPANPSLQRALARCLARTIRHACTWFAANAPVEYSRRRIRWSLNLGFPRKSLPDSPLRRAYQSIALTAMQDAFTPKTARTKGVERSATAVATPTLGTAGCVELYPEIAAQLAGYVKSPYCKPGSLLLVDVGAGTLDASTLIVGQNEGEDFISFQFCEVTELGALRLLERRMQAVESVHRGAFGRSLATFQDGTVPLPESVGELICSPPPAAHNAFEKAGQAFREQVLESLLRCLTQFRMRLRACHAQRGVDPWGSNLRVMLAGGGSRSAFYLDLVAGGPLEAQLVRYTRWDSDSAMRKRNGQGLRPEPLPVPTNLVNLPRKLHSEFHRLSVAHGLALGRRNLMRVMNSEQEEKENTEHRGEDLRPPRAA